jgi:hypothetical protein
LIMSFVTPLFIFGALATAVPILLHLIKRESAQKIPFPTLMFLRKISKRTIRYQKLRHLLLLLLRVLALLLLAFGFMRPFWYRAQAAADTGRVAQVHVILLDNSMSMAYGERWQRAREAAKEIMRRAEPGDKVSLLEFSDRTTVLSQPATDFEMVLDQVDTGTELTDRPTRYGQALKIAEKVALEAGMGARIIHLISDFQKSGWATEERDFRLGSSVKLEPMDVGEEAFSNLALGDVQLIEADENTEGGLNIRFSVANFGVEDRNAARVTLAVDDRVVDEKLVDAARGSVQGLEFQLPGLTAGMHDVTLAVEDPRLTRDNRFSMTVEARSKISVLSVENPSAGRGERSPSFFLASALNVSSISPYRLVSVAPRTFESMESVAGGLVIWNNVSGSGAPLQKKLQDFVRGGGGLIIVLADSSMASDFNRSFGSWIPVAMEATAGTAAGQSRLQRRDVYSLLTDLQMDHPIFRPFNAPHSGTFVGARFFSHARLRANEGSQVLARFDNGDPALIAAEVDKGRVLIMAFSADDATNDLPLKAVFAPFWHQILRYLENFRQDRQWLYVGDTIAPRKLLVEAAVRQGKVNANLDQAVVVMDPSKNRVSMPPEADALAVDMAGFYDIRTSDLSTSVAVNPVPRESDLSHGNVEEMTAGWISTESDAPAVVSPDEIPTAEEQDKREKIWRYLLLGVLAALIFEGLLANRFVMKPE